MRKQLTGHVVKDEDLWLYSFFDLPAFSPQMVRDALEELPEGEDLILEINSGGGSVYAGFEMYTVLMGSPRHTVAEVQSLAASAASVLMLGCREVVASPVAQVMIHLPMVSTDGDRYDHLKSIDVLDTTTESILNAYAMKCGARTTRDELKRMMRTSTWLTAPEAKDFGLVDHILGEELIDPNTILNCAGGVSHGIRSMGAQPMPSPAALRAEYDRLVEAGKAPARGPKVSEAAPEETPPDNKESKFQAAVARLALEKMRF